MYLARYGVVGDPAIKAESSVSDWNFHYLACCLYDKISLDSKLGSLTSNLAAKGMRQMISAPCRVRLVTFLYMISQVARNEGVTGSCEVSAIVSVLYLTLISYKVRVY